VSILTAHKILIASAVALFFGYGVWEFLRYTDPGGAGSLLRGGASWLAALGLGVYLRAVFRKGGWVDRGRSPSRRGG